MKNLPCAVGGTVVDENDLVRDAAEFHLEVQMLDGGGDAAFLVARWNDYGEQAQ